jgi:2-dehydro-3-deoxygluconokinase
MPDIKPGKDRNLMMKKVTTFGEIMLRLTPEGYTRFVQAEHFGATYGGGEANVAVSLANFGMDAAFVTRLPGHEIGQAAVNSLRRYGVDTSKIIRGGQRVGIYYLEKGASQRPSKVIYDREGSAISQADQSDFDWEKIFKGADWFHFTGITPALGSNIAEICLEACRTAKANHMTVSCDLNYRKNLWSREEAGRTMEKLMPFVDICIANEEDAADVFGIKAENTDVNTGKVSYDGYKEVAKKLEGRFGFEKVAVTLRGSVSANDNNWAAMLYDGGNYYFSNTYPIHIVDRVGGGDSFGAGLIYSLLSGYDAPSALEFAVAASCLKHTIEGDFNHASVSDVQRLAGGDAS